jgi:uncharacterized membrane protein
MLKRTCVTLSWQRLIGVASGTFGAAVTVATGAQLSMAGSLRAQTLPGLIASIFGCVFLFLAFPLFTGREWARRALLLATYSVLAALAISFSFMVVQQVRSSSASHPALRLLIGACALVALLAPPAFILAVLHHADIKRAFRTKDASNQSLQPTAGRSDV